MQSAAFPLRAGTYCAHASAGALRFGRLQTRKKTQEVSISIIL